MVNEVLKEELAAGVHALSIQVNCRFNVLNLVTSI